MVSYTTICVLQVFVVIFGTANITCNIIKERCIDEINQVFGHHTCTTPLDYVRYAMQFLKVDMIQIRDNVHALRYYYELKKHLTADRVVNPKKCLKYSLESRNDLVKTFGVIPIEIVHNAYLNNTYDKYLENSKNDYMKQIIEHFGVDDEDTIIKPLNFCEKEQAEYLCRRQIDHAFEECNNENDCINYAMSTLTQDSDVLLDNVYAMNYFDALRDRLDNVSFTARVEDPVTYFNRFFDITNNENIHALVIDTANLILFRFRGNKLAFATYVYNYEVMNIDDKSLYQLYVRHVIQQCSENDFQTSGNFSPEYYCNIVRQNTN